jgi:hypothetical protein
VACCMIKFTFTSFTPRSTTFLQSDVINLSSTTTYYKPWPPVEVRIQSFLTFSTRWQWVVCC